MDEAQTRRRTNDDQARASFVGSFMSHLLEDQLKARGMRLGSWQAADPRGDNDGGCFVRLYPALQQSMPDEPLGTLGIYRVDYGDGDEWSFEAYNEATGNASTQTGACRHLDHLTAAGTSYFLAVALVEVFPAFAPGTPG